MAHFGLHFLTVLLWASSTLSQDLTLDAPAKAPSDASLPVDRSFLGLMIECTSLPDFAGSNAAPNAFSRALLRNLGDNTGVATPIRVGGTSEDQAFYNASQKEAIKWLTSDRGLLAPISLGPLWLESLRQFPGTKWVLEVPAAIESLGVDSAVAFAKVAVPAIGMKNLDGLEIGNEPDLYNLQHRRTDFTQGRHVDEFHEYTDAISGKITLPPGPMYQAGVIASDSAGKWTAESLYTAGLAKIPNTIKTFAMHYYQTTTAHTLASTLLSHANTVARTKDMFQSSISYLREHQPNVPFVIGEAGSALAADGHPARPTEGSLDRVLGSALWTVDWLLLAMSMNVFRVNMAQCTVCNFRAWTPVARGGALPNLQAQYYGLYFVSEWLGLGRSSAQSLRVRSLFDKAHPNLSAYAGYRDNTLERVAVIDLNEWNATSSGPRPERWIALPVPAGVARGELRRLTGSGTDAPAGNMTYRNLRFTLEHPGGDFPPNMPVGERTTVEKISVRDGKARFRLKASEAALVQLF